MGLYDDAEAWERIGPIADQSKINQQRTQLRYPPTPEELDREYAGYVGAIEARHIEQLRSLGVSASDIAIHQMVGVARIKIPNEENPLRRWLPDEKGSEVFVTPVRRLARTDSPVDLEVRDPWESNRHGQTRDLIAWHPSRPDSFAARTGSELILGSVQFGHGVAHALGPTGGPHEQAVPVYKTPLNWLRASAILQSTTENARKLSEGVVVLAKDQLSLNAAVNALARHGALGPESHKQAVTPLRDWSIDEKPLVPKQVRNNGYRM